jgi:hypothetical protein
MEFWVVGSVDEDVIHVDSDISFVYEVSKDVIHHGLKCHRGIGESEEHDHGFKEPLICFKCSLPLVSIMDADIIVAPSYVELHEQRVASDAINEFGDEGQWIAVADCKGIQLPIVLYWP